MLEIIPTSESAVVCRLPPPASLENQQRFWAFAAHLREYSRIREVVVGMNNVTVFVHYPVDFTRLAADLKKTWQKTTALDYQSRLVEIPVRYGGQWGEDLTEVAAFHHTTPENIVALHTQPVYTVFMIGFQAGFPYLGGLPESLHTPRRAEPRTLVPAGSVGIGGSQTGIYPFASPGGWRLIGHTSVPLFDKNQLPPTLLKTGDRVRFIAEKIDL
ncbi:5-oxoprolinase subunit PxpB [Exercitatus varius]|uniref:5-oxoprolinase subunit PxpB n=1 Tax=Exercitatus varius TaxID=67857 RepID=UPI00294AE92F|nr:5-oxoprolinase subunit PxpB [Exercitatus varius]MDG2941813.1 5-oxoprolinase subunit PxpB [Exercitatus varius]